MFENYLNQKKRDVDWPLLIATLGLAVIGVFFVASATADETAGAPLYRQKYFLQIVWCLGGLVAGAIVCWVDYGKWARWSRVIYWLSIVSLVALFVVGAVHHGGKRWINLGGFSLQPSEFAKIAYLFLMADYLSRPVEELRKPRVFFAALGYTLLPFVLIWKEPDIGSALAFLSVCLALMFVSGVPNRFLLRLAGCVVPVVALVVALVLFAPASSSVVKQYQKNRIRSYFGIGGNNDADYNVKQSLISVGSGGFWGKGWRQGTVHQLGFLPSLGAHDDFIFSVFAEEEGFVGSVLILALYSVLLFSGIKVAGQARDRLGQLLAVGVVTLLFTHVFINIGMNIRLMPVTGIPLPLVSYGGTSVVCSLIAIGILHNVHLHRKTY